MENIENNDIKTFAAATTKNGFISFYKNLKDMYSLDKLFILKGTSGSGKSTFLKKFRDEFRDNKAVLLLCSFDPDSLDGVILPDLKVGVIDGTAPHVVDDGIIIELTPSEVPIKKIQKIILKKSKLMKKVELVSAKAFCLHQKVEEYYKQLVDFSFHDELLNNLVSEVKTIKADNKPAPSEKTGIEEIIEKLTAEELEELISKVMEAKGESPEPKAENPEPDIVETIEIMQPIRF